MMGKYLLLVTTLHVLMMSLMMSLIMGVPLADDGGGGGTTGEVVTTTPTTAAAEAEDDVDYYEDEDYEYQDTLDGATPSPAHPPISDHLPRFIVSLPDTHLLCFSIEGFELFTYNLLSTPHIHINSFLNITQTPTGEWVRGGTDLGFIMKIKDERVKSGQRLFKIKVNGAAKKAEIAGFGEVDMQGGSVEFTIDEDGHSNIESSEAPNEQFMVSMESPKVTIWAVSTNRVTFNVYIQDSSGLADIPSHGILGQFLRPGVEIDVESGQLKLGPDRDPIPVSVAPVWDSVQDKGYKDKQCWYLTDQDSLSVLEGEPYDYVTEYILSHKYQFSQFDPKTPL